MLLHLQLRRRAHYDLATLFARLFLTKEQKSFYESWKKELAATLGLISWDKIAQRQQETIRAMEEWTKMKSFQVKRMPTVEELMRRRHLEARQKRGSAEFQQAVQQMQEVRDE